MTRPAVIAVEGDGVSLFTFSSRHETNDIHINPKHVAFVAEEVWALPDGTLQRMALIHLVSDVMVAVVDSDRTAVKRIRTEQQRMGW